MTLTLNCFLDVPATASSIGSGIRPLTLSAYSAIQSDTNSAELYQTDMGTNVFPLPYGIFQPAAYRTVERLNWITPIEDDWNESSMTAQINATIPTNQSNTSTWLLYAVRVPDGGTLTTAIPLVATLTVTYVTAYKTYASAVSSQFDITGTGKTILWELKRGTVGDTLSINALFLNCKIVYGV